MQQEELADIAQASLGQPFEDLSEREQHVIEAMVTGEPVAENVNQLFREQTTFWQRLADKLAQVVGSWPFIFLFLLFLLLWMIVNSLILSRVGTEFDPYPYILLNLVLSTVASIQAPIIMMSQNRQSEKDRITASNAFEVNLKTELAIQQLHEKVDALLEAKNSRDS